MKRKLLLIAVPIFVIGIILLFSAGKSREFEYLTSPETEEDFRFPERFLWGVATADQQIERNQNSDWTAFVQEASRRGKKATVNSHPAPGNITGIDFDPEVISRTSDFDAKMEEYLAEAAAMGANAFRFSFSWARLFPQNTEQPSADGIAFYRRMFSLLKKYRLKPSATIFHFSSPLWFWQKLKGRRGWEREDALKIFEHYVRALAENFGGEVNHWCTLNEPMVYVYNGYMKGVFPPLEKRSDPGEAGDVIAQLLRAHALAYRILKADAVKRGVVSEVGFTRHTRDFQPLRNWHPLDRLTAAMVEEGFIWDFQDAALTGKLKLAGSGYRAEIPGLAGTSDYTGINYYGRFYVKSGLIPGRYEIAEHDPDTDNAVNDLGWAHYPAGFQRLLKEFQRRNPVPIYVMENGTADHRQSDYLRKEMILTHVREIGIARKRGIDIRGYFHWSLMDNFEWAEGFSPRFGLLAVDYNNGLRLTRRESFGLYSRIIREGLSAGFFREQMGLVTSEMLKEKNGMK